MTDTNVPTRVPSGVATGGVPTQGGPLPSRAAAAVQPASAGLVDVACPGCGTPARIRADRRSASDFCATCDHPLFWAGPAPGAAEVVEDPGLDARFRAPGVVGAAQHAPVPCPRCGELNHTTWAACVRCGADLAPPPPTPAPPPPAPAPPRVVTVERPVPCGHPPVWLVVLISSFVTAAAVAGAFLTLG